MGSLVWFLSHSLRGTHVRDLQRIGVPFFMGGVPRIRIVVFGGFEGDPPHVTLNPKPLVFGGFEGDPPPTCENSEARPWGRLCQNRLPHCRG